MEVGLGGAVNRARRGGDHQLPGLHALRDAAAGSHADEALRPESQQLFDDDAEARRAHAAGLDAHREAVEGAGEAEEAAVIVDLLRRAGVKALADSARSVGVAGKEDQGGVVTLIGAEVDLWHVASVQNGASRAW